MQSISLIKKTTGVSAFLLVGLAFAYSLVEMQKEAVYFLGIWAVIIFAIILKINLNNKQLFHYVMYLLVMTTFLNQSVLSLHIGFFSLFLYRVILIAAVILFILQAMKEKNLPQLWNQVNVKEVLHFLLFWMAYGAISLLWAKSIVEGIKALFLLGLGISFVFLAVFTFRSMTRLILFYGIWMSMTIILLLIGFINHFAHIQLPTSTLYGASEPKVSYPTSVFFNQNDFATFLTISFFFYLSLIKNGKNVFLKTTSLLLAILCAYSIYLTESRASILGILIGLIAYLFILLPKFLKKIAVISGSAIIIVSTVVFWGKIVHLFDGLLSAAAASQNNEMLPSNVARLNLLKNTIHFTLQTFGFGVGAGNIPFYLKNEFIYPTNHVVEVHNWLAEIMGNYGLIILLGYVTMYTYLFISLYKAYQEKINRKHKMLLEACMMGLIGFLVSSISPSSISNLFYHWVFIGFVIATVSVYKGRLQEEKSY